MNVLNSVAMADAGLTYRQLDYWTNKGYLYSTNSGCGSGHERHWPDSELRVAATMRRLVEAGLTVKAAHTVARGGSELAPGVRVLVDSGVPS